MAAKRINLALSGGGVRLPAHVGAIMALRDLGAEIVRVAGVSGGSVVGAFLAAGFSDKQMQDIAVNTDYREFIDISPLAMLVGNGLCSGRRFERWLDDHLNGARFRDLPMDFRVVATDILEHKPVIFSPRETPDVRVAYAVRCSMGIPGFFACKRWRGHMLVDGGMIPGALWDIFYGTSDAGNIYVLLSMPQPPRRQKKRFYWTWNYASLIVRTLMFALDGGRIPAHIWKETVLIETGNTLSSVDFNINASQKMELLVEAYRQVKTYASIKSDLFAVR